MKCYRLRVEIDIFAYVRNDTKLSGVLDSLITDLQVPPSQGLTGLRVFIPPVSGQKPHAGVFSFRPSIHA
jgi:hypothetical protein